MIVWSVLLGGTLAYVAVTYAHLWRTRPVVTKDPHTGDLQIVRSPNPCHKPRRHHREARP